MSPDQEYLNAEVKSCINLVKVKNCSFIDVFIPWARISTVFHYGVNSIPYLLYSIVRTFYATLFLTQWKAIKSELK